MGMGKGHSEGLLHAAAVVAQNFALLTEMLGMFFALIGNIQAVWLFQGSLQWREGNQIRYKVLSLLLFVMPVKPTFKESSYPAMPAEVTNIRISCYKKAVLMTYRYYIAKWGFPNTQSWISEDEIFEVEQLQSY